MYKSKVIPYLFILPFLIFAIIFLLYPFVKNITDSFYEYESMLDKVGTFVKLDNYIELFENKYFQYSLKNTLFLILLVIIFQVGTALLLSLLVSSIKKFATFFKVSFFMPIVISATALGLMFNLFYDYEYGMFNQILALMKIDKFMFIDLQNVSKTFAFVMAPVIWQYIGFYFVIFLAALTNIPDELLEAAEMDGCTGLKKIWYVKLPMLRNVTSTVLVLAITGTLKVFDLPFIIAPNGYPNGKNHLLGTLMHSLGFNGSDIGQSAAFAVIMVILGVLLSVIANRLFKQTNDF